MKIKGTTYSLKSGGALVLVMVVMLAITVLILGLFRLYQSDGVESVYARQSEQAFWLAEAGVQDAVQRISFNHDFSGIPAMNFAKGSYAVEIINTGLDYSYPVVRTNLTVKSQGLVGSMRRMVIQEISVQPGSKYAVIGVDGVTVVKEAVIAGILAQLAGGVDIKKIDGAEFLVVESGVIVDAPDSMTVEVVDEIPVPTVDTSEYLNALSSVANPTNSVTNVNDLVISGTNVFNQSVVFDGQDVVVESDAVIVASGDIEFSKSGARVEPRAKIISGNNIVWKVQADVFSDVEIVAMQDITFQSGSELNPLEPVMLLSIYGDILMNSNFEFTGVIIAMDGSVTLDSGGTVSGTVIGQNVTLESNVTIDYNEAIYNHKFPFDSGGGIIVRKIRWQEIAP